MIRVTVLVVVAFVKKKKEKKNDTDKANYTEQHAEQTLNLQVSILVFVHDSYLFYDSCILWTLSYGESKSTTSDVL